MGFKVTQAYMGSDSTSAHLYQSTGIKVYQVSGTAGTIATVDNALGAVDDSIQGQQLTFSNATLWIPSVGTGYASNSVLSCCSVKAENTGFGYIKVTANFAIGNFVAFQNPLAMPPLIEWQQNVQVEDTDRDYYKNIITNSAGDPPPGGLKRNMYVDVLRITKNLPAYSPATGQQYRNTINNAAFSVCGISVSQGYARCAGLSAPPYRTTDQWVPVTMTLEIADANLPDNPWQYRFIDKGSNAWATDNDTGSSSPTTYKGRILWLGTHQPPTSDILLNGSGQPIDTTYLEVAKKQGQTPSTSFVNEPTNYITDLKNQTPPQVLVESMGNCVHLVWTKLPALSWNGLLTYMGFTASGINWS